MKILLTGVTGYIGRRVLPVLVEAGHKVICLARNPERLILENFIKEKVDVIQADLLDVNSLNNIPDDIEAAYYFVHSMSQSSKQFSDLEDKAAVNFLSAIKQTNCEQIIYLSGIPHGKNLSKHMASRYNVENRIKESGINYTVLRTGIIIGSGSASFEIIRNLVEKLPVMVAPKWLNVKHQPVAIRDVIFYLKEILNNELCMNKSFDIGGPDILTYKEMLLKLSKIRKLKRFIITVPVLTPRLSSYWLYFVTSTNFTLARSLVESMKNEVIVKNDEISAVIKHHCLSYERAIQNAFKRIAENMVISSWKDAWSSGNVQPEYSDFIKTPTYGCLIDEQKIIIKSNIETVIEKIWTIGGDKGWYYGNWLWKIRGILDKVVGGVGLRRGRRDLYDLREGDALDFWRVIFANKNNKRLMLYAEMKLPGEAWLEFKIDTINNNPTLVQTATFRPKGVLGRLYWYSLSPFHFFIFRKMAQRIAEQNK